MTITGSNVTLMVNNMDTSINFYESIGLKLKNRWDDHYAMMTAEGITLGIHPKSNAVPNSGTVSIGFMIANINDAKLVLDKNKIAYKSEDDGKSGLYAHFTDPDGTILYFVEPKW